MDFYLDLFYRSYPLFLKGALMTVTLLCCSAIMSSILGLVFGVFSCEKLKVRIISSLIELMTFILRGVPFFVQLLIVYYVLPDLLGFNLSAFTASFIALGLCSAGYVSQLVRGGLNSISVTQWEAAFSLGYNTTQSLIFVILPQVFRNILPMFNNELEALLKSTSIASSIGMLELTRIGMNLVSREMEPVPIYLTIAFFYLCLSALFSLITRKIENKITYVKR